MFCECEDNLFKGRERGLTKELKEVFVIPAPQLHTRCSDWSFFVFLLCHYRLFRVHDSRRQIGNECPVLCFDLGVRVLRCSIVVVVAEYTSGGGSDGTGRWRICRERVADRQVSVCEWVREKIARQGKNGSIATASGVGEEAASRWVGLPRARPCSQLGL